MDENGHRENGRHKPPQGPWLMQHHPSMKQIMSIMAERDAAIQERNLALSEKKSALAERDTAIQQRDSAISDRNNAIKERDNAIATLQYRENTVNYNNAIPQPHVVEQARYNIGRLALIKGDMQITDSPEPAKSARRAKRPKKVIKQEGKPECKPEPDSWKEQDLGLNQVSFDETSMPGPVCSCTGSLRPCYKWGNGGWQSSCCTTNLSIYPLPAVPNKRHARVGGRKMSGGAFNKLISRLAAEGHDLSNPVDLKDNWAKHGTNRYITIK